MALYFPLVMQQLFNLNNFVTNIPKIPFSLFLLQLTKIVCKQQHRK